MAERRTRRAAGPLVSAAAVLAMTGCAADYVGDDWQCPLAQGKVCASVAAADPAVPETQGTASLDDDIPPYRRLDGRIAAGAWAGRGEPTCESDCDPFAWFAGLFAGPDDTGPAAAGQDDDIDAVGTTASLRNGNAAAIASSDLGEHPVADTLGATQDAAAAAGHPAFRASAADSSTTASAIPDDAPSPRTDRAAGDPGTDVAAHPADDGALRTGEVVARIWIAPFVDAEGIYREGSWIRAVIAPAAWRLP